MVGVRWPWITGAKRPTISGSSHVCNIIIESRSSCKNERENVQNRVLLGTLRIARKSFSKKIEKSTFRNMDYVKHIFDLPKAYYLPNESLIENYGRKGKLPKVYWFDGYHHFWVVLELAYFFFLCNYVLLKKWSNSLCTWMHLIKN